MRVIAKMTVHVKEKGAGMVWSFDLTDMNSSSKQLSHSSFPQIRFIRLEESFSLRLVQICLRCRWILGSLVWAASVSGCKVLRRNKASLLVRVNWLQIRHLEQVLREWVIKSKLDLAISLSHSSSSLSFLLSTSRLDNSRWLEGSWAILESDWLIELLSSS